MSHLCEKCGIEMEQDKVVVSQNNPNPYPQGSMRKYVCPKCGAKIIEEGITESDRPPKE
jgi:DNA-directed RNA polymerase subunit RPC12/RpoP